MSHGPLDIVAPDGWDDDPRPLVIALTHSAEPSGAELFLMRVTARMTRFRPLVVLGARGPLEQMLIDRGVAVAVLPLDPRAASQRADDSMTPIGALRQGTTLLAHARVLAHEFAHLRPALVWTHSAKAHLYGGIAGRLAHVPVVAHVHDLVRRPGASSLGIVAMTTALRVLPHGVVTNSRTTLRSIGGAGRRRDVTVIGCPVVLDDGAGVGLSGPAPAGVPVSADTSSPLVDASSPLVVGVLGRLAPWKGQHVVIRAFALAVRRGDLPPDSRLRVIGAATFDADRAYADSLQRLADAELPGRVEFTGHVADPGPAIRACDVIVHASTRPEPFGQVVVEAMACGRAVVASAEGGPSEVITHRVDGLLVTPDDHEALADALTLLSIDPALRHALGAAAVRSAERFAPDVVVAAIEGFLRHCSAL